VLKWERETQGCGQEQTGWGPENEDFGPENEALQVRTLDGGTGNLPPAQGKAAPAQSTQEVAASAPWHEWRLAGLAGRRGLSVPGGV